MVSSQGEIILIATTKFISLEIWENKEKMAEFQIPENTLREYTARELYKKWHTVFKTKPYKDETGYFY